MQVTLKGSKCFDKPVSFMAVAYNDESHSTVCTDTKYATHTQFCLVVSKTLCRHI